MKQLEKILKEHHYLEKGNNFYKRNGDFFICLYFQWSESQGGYFINLGIQPAFLNIQSDYLYELDCEFRTRIELSYQISNNINLSPQHLSEFLNAIKNIEKEYFSYVNIFKSKIANVDLDNDILLDKFSITKVNLCKLYVEYYHYQHNKIIANEFAHYGLQICPKLAVSPRKFFKEFLGK